MFNGVHFPCLAQPAWTLQYPHLCSLSTFILFNLFLKRQICCWMSHTFTGPHSGCLLTGVQTYGMRHSKKLAQDSPRNGDLILSKICCGHCLWNERRTALEGSAPSFVLYLSTFSGAAMNVQLVFYLVWVLFSTLRKAVMLIAQCMTESLNTSKASHCKRKNGDYSVSYCLLS